MGKPKEDGHAHNFLWETLKRKFERGYYKLRNGNGTSDILVSVIIPVYNAGNYLRQCLDSVIGQTLREIEIICVNDGSTDDSLCILEEYARKDDRIVVVSKENENAGAGSARNLGISLAKGEYLSILDADDFFDKNLLAETVNSAQKHDADVVLFNSYIYDHVKKTVTTADFAVNKSVLPEKSVFSRADFAERIFQCTIGAAWCLLLRRDFVERHCLRFQAVHHADDFLFTYSVLALAQRITFVDKKLLYYRINNEHSQTVKKSAHYQSAFAAPFELKNFLIRNWLYYELKRSFINKALAYTLWYLNTADNWRYFSDFYVALKNTYFELLDIEDKPPDYFYDIAWYSQYREICRRTPEKYLFWRLYGL
ncbi:MAG: glycosyltransferase [Synergistaceae bacterium]|jgi:glycosyltransferase involved in cell wall biosynthesis|nr:glycosyltransferase [Synergistaceae bacterium]